MEAEPLLAVRGLSKVYRRSGGWGKKVEITALDNVSFEIERHSIVAVVGESGGGKSTLARCLALLEEPTAGEIRVGGRRVNDLGRREIREQRRRCQLIFQDAAAAINPGFSAIEAVAEPLLIRRWGDRTRRREKALELMDETGLAADLAERSSLELSGGQKQRLVIARALAADPEILVLDEGLSGLDLSLQAQIVNLLLRLRASRRLTYVLISHDLRMVAHLADRVLVMHRGRLVESAAASEILRRPQHAATKALVSSMPGRAPTTASGR